MAVVHIHPPLKHSASTSILKKPLAEPEPLFELTWETFMSREDPVKLILDAIRERTGQNYVPPPPPTPSAPRVAEGHGDLYRTDRRRDGPPPRDRGFSHYPRRGERYDERHDDRESYRRY